MESLLLLWKKFEMNNRDDRATLLLSRDTLDAWKAAADATKINGSTRVIASDLMVDG